jgi:hypothetical protein
VKAAVTARRDSLSALAAAALLLLPAVAPAQPAGDGYTRVVDARNRCPIWDQTPLTRNPTPGEIRCRYGTHGPGRFGLSEYMEVPVYQPATPLPGTHVVGVSGMPRPLPGESYEEWEWRVLRTDFPPRVRNVNRGLDVVDPVFASRLIEFESRLQAAGVRFSRRETWRSPERQAWLFQQGRSRPGAMVTATLTSWHSQVDERGAPFARAADYNVSRAQMPRFHEVAWESGLETYGPESNDPGHVFLPGAESMSSRELVYLRLLPRVSHVTLSTGRPSDERVERHHRAEFRLASEQFAYEPFFPFPRPTRLAAVQIPTAPVFAPRPPPPTPGIEVVEERAEPGGALGALVAWLRERTRR